MAKIEKTYAAEQSHDDYSATEKESVFGGETDTWGAELTPEMINSEDFAILFDGSSMGTGLFRVDAIEVEVFYTLPGSGELDITLPPYAANMSLSEAAIGPGPTIVAVGRSGKILRSTDEGGTWTAIESGVADTLWGVSYGDETFIAVGENGTVLISEDLGLTWAREDSATSENIYSVSYNPVARDFVAVGRTAPRRRVRDSGWNTSQN